MGKLSLERSWAAFFCLAAPRVAAEGGGSRGTLPSARRAGQLQLAGLQGPRLSRASQARLEAYLGSKPALAAAPGSTWQAQDEQRPSSCPSESDPPSSQGSGGAIEDLALHFGQLAISRGSWGSTRSAHEAETCSPRSQATCTGRASRMEGCPAREEGPDPAEDGAAVALPAGIAEMCSGSEGGGGEALRARPAQRRGTLVRRASTGVIVMEQEEDGEEGGAGAQGAAGLEGSDPPPAPRPLPRQRLMTGVCAHHHTSLSRLKSQMGNVGEPAGDLLALMARRVFAQQSVAMNRISSSGLLSELAAQSSQPTLNTPTPSGRDPVLPRIRVRMPSSSNRSTSG